MTIACFPGTLLVTYCSYRLLFNCLVSSVLNPVGQRLSWAFTISSDTRWGGQPLSLSARLMMACSTESGVDIIPPHLLTRAGLRVDNQRTVWMAFSVSSELPRPPHTADARMLRTISLRMRISRFWSCNWISSWSTFDTNSSICSDLCLIMRWSSRTQLCWGTSSKGTTKPHPCSHDTGRFGLYKHSLWCAARASKRTTWLQPNSLFPQQIFSRERRLRKILGGWIRSSSGETGFLSTGQTCWCFSHSLMHELQKQCSHWRICTGSSNTRPHMAHSSSSSTGSWKRLTSKPIWKTGLDMTVRYWEKRCVLWMIQDMTERSRGHYLEEGLPFLCAHVRNGYHGDCQSFQLLSSRILLGSWPREWCSRSQKELVLTHTHPTHEPYNRARSTANSEKLEIWSQRLWDFMYIH